MLTPHDANPHQHLIETRLPTWSHRASPEHWQSLRQSHTPEQGLPGAEADWFANAAPDLREAVLASQARLQRSQQALARSLKGLKQIAEFAEPLLGERLRRDHAFTASLADCELLSVQQTWHWQGGVYTYSHERQSLLQAALQNFGDDAAFGEHSAVALAANIRVQPITVQGSVFVSPDGPGAPLALASQAYQVIPLPLAPEAFAAACRQLDLGQRYQTHLQQVFESPQSQARVREQAIAVHRDRLRLAADLGYLRHRLSGTATDAIQSLLDDGAPQCWRLSLFSIVLHDLLIIDADTAGFLLYLPAGAVALRQFPTLAALYAALGADLLTPAGLQAVVTCVPLQQRADFTRLLQQNLAGDLHFERRVIDQPVFGVLQDAYLARLKSEARVLAVPTVDADEHARRRRLAHWESLGMDALTMAGFFIPAVGTLLLAVTACQVLDEVYEGYQAWSIGDRAQALRHCEAVGLNLAMLGGIYLAAHVVPDLLSSPLMESLDAVRLDDGSRRLWRPDLAAYRQDSQLADGVAANVQGQHVLRDGRHFIQMDSALYEQRLEQKTHQWRIVHPDDPQAYQPALEHNGEGAWRTEHEQPQDWTYPTLVRRLRAAHDTFSDAELEMARHICGVGKAQLQHTLLSNQPAPLLLIDTLERIAAQRVAALAPAELRAEAFRQAYEGMPAADPAVDRLRSRYPRLSQPLAQRLLNRLSASERLAWDAEAQLPISLDIEQLHSDLPLAHAMEGLYLSARATRDSDRLAFACLERLPGWPAHLRLELRGASPQGPLLASAGLPRAQVVRTLLKHADGYEAYRGERPAAAAQGPDLCQAVLRALAPEHRQALALSADDATGLRHQLQALASESRASLNRYLWRPAQDHRAVLSLRGGAPTEYPVSALRASLISRYRRLYPRATDAEIENTLRTWRRQLRTPELELQRLEDRLREIREQLAAWAQAQPRRRPAVQRLIDAWRLNEAVTLMDGTVIQQLSLCGLGLETLDLASLDLPAEFTHVEVINLSENRHLTELPATFIERFPGLRHLYLNHCRFDRLPSLPDPGSITWLDMQGNRITWDAQAQAALERFANLRILDLSDNPLLQAPDLRQIQGLDSLFLNACSLTELPQGLESMLAPLVLDLSDNQLIRLPENLQLTADAGQAMRLESRWLSPAVHEQIAAYYEAHEIDLLVADTDYEELLDLADQAQWQIWTRLPLQYRRDLRTLLDSEFFLTEPEQAHAELWRRLRRLDSDPQVRSMALDRPASQLFELPI